MHCSCPSLHTTEVRFPDTRQKLDSPFCFFGRAAFAAVAAVAKRFSFCGCYSCFCEHVLEKGVEDRGWELVPSNTVRDKNHVRWEAGLPSPYRLPPPCLPVQVRTVVGGTKQNYKYRAVGRGGKKTPWSGLWTRSTGLYSGTRP